MSAYYYIQTRVPPDTEWKDYAQAETVEHADRILKFHRPRLSERYPGIEFRLSPREDW